MPFTLMQVGNALKTVNTDGGLSSALTLPNGVSLAINLQPRFARFKNYVVLVNTPSRPISIGTDGTVRPLTPNPPGTAVQLSAGATGTLTGSYLSLETFKILDSSGNVIAESDYGPAMSAYVTISSKKLHAHFPTSGETAVNAIQLYRTTTLGATYLPWTLVSGNSTTDIENDISDAALGIVAGPELGTAPDLTLIAEFGGRLWGVARNDVDSLRYTSAGTMYGWSTLNTLLIPHVGSDGAGITALIPRRAALGVSRRNVFSQVTGSQRLNIAPVIVNGGENVGCVSQESVVVFKDVAYFLGQDGVYQWDSNGITCISDGRVRTWFTTDETFNKSMFWRAFAEFDPIGKKYRLFLAEKGADRITHWVEYDILNGTWWGPHLTDAFAPSSAFLVAGRNQQLFPMIGSREGYLSQDQPNRNDWDLYPIDFDVKTRSLVGDSQEQAKYYGELSVYHQRQDAGELTVTPSLGPLDEEVDQTPFTSDMTRGRRRLGRIGVGESMALEFENNVLNQDVVLEGFEIDPVDNVGRR